MLPRPSTARAVGDDRDHARRPGEPAGELRLGGDGAGHPRDARGVGQREVVDRGDRPGRRTESLPPSCTANAGSSAKRSADPCTAVCSPMDPGAYVPPMDTAAVIRAGRGGSRPDAAAAGPRRGRRRPRSRTPGCRRSTNGLSPSTQCPPGTGRRTRFTTSSSGRDGKRARTTSPARTASPGADPADEQPVAVPHGGRHRRPARPAPAPSAVAQRGGPFPGTCRCRSPRVGSQTTRPLDFRRHVHAFDPHVLRRGGHRTLRPPLRRVRPGPGPHRGRVRQGHPGEVPGQRGPGLPSARRPDQGAAFRPGQAPPVGAVDRLLQAPALREVPRSCTSCSTRPPSRPARPAARAAWTRPRARSSSTTSPRSTRSSGRRRPRPDLPLLPGAAGLPSTAARQRRRMSCSTIPAKPRLRLGSAHARLGGFRDRRRRAAGEGRSRSTRSTRWRRSPPRSARWSTPTR